MNVYDLNYLNVLKKYFQVERDFIVLFNSGSQTVVRGALVLHECSKISADVKYYFLTQFCWLILIYYSLL